MRGARLALAASGVSGRGAPDFTGGGGRGGLAQRETGAVLAREIAALQPGADRRFEARGGLEGRGPGRGLSPGRRLPRPASRRLRGKPRPRGRIRGKSPSGERRRPGVQLLELRLDFKNPPLCARVERCQAPRPLPFTLTAFNWCREPGVPGRRCRSAPVRPAVERRRAGADLRPPAAPRRPRSPRLGEGWAEKILSVLVIFPGNLSFRTSTPAPVWPVGRLRKRCSHGVFEARGFESYPPHAQMEGVFADGEFGGKVPPSHTLSH